MKTPILALALSALAFWGCAQKEFVFSQTALCNAPIASISLQNITKKNSDATLSEDEFKKILVEIIQGTQCLELISSPKEESYVLNTSYEVDLTHSSEQEALSTEHTQSLNAKVVLNISDRTQLRQDIGQSTIQVQEKEILGAGRKEQISRADEISALKNSILIALKSFIASIDQAPQEENPF